jgi:hypothetical protein
MSHTKRVWIVDVVSHFVVERHGAVFQYQINPTERNGFTSTKEAKRVLYVARKALRAPYLQIMKVGP